MELLTCHKMNQPIPCLSVCFDSAVHEYLDISFTFMQLWWLSCPVLLQLYAQAFQFFFFCLQTSRERLGRGENKEEGECSK